MAWIESHQTLGQHPKTLALAAGLGCSLPTAVGHLQYLWWWALDYAQDGLVTARTRPIAIRACQVQRQPDRFWSALVDAGFVDLLDDAGPTWRIHDWREYAGRLIDRRHNEAERKRTARAENRNTSAGQAPDVRRMSGSRLPVPNQPDRTGHNQPDRTGTSPSPESEFNPAGSARQPRAYARETAESPELLAEHLRRLEQERASHAKPSQPSEKSSQDDEETHADG